MRYFIGFLITVGLIILLIFMLLRGGNKQPEVPTTSKTLDSYASTSADVSMTTDFEVNANQEHRQVRVTVGRDNVNFQVLRGYDGDVTMQRQFANTQSAYSAFLKSLEKAGFTQGDTSKKLADERGYCATGERYIFVLQQDTTTVQRFWATSCSSSAKTYLGSLSLTRDLFEAQVPDYQKLLNDADL